MDATSLAVPLPNRGWEGGALLPATGKIYGIPTDADAVLVIDSDCSVDEPLNHYTQWFVNVHVMCGNTTETVVSLHSNRAKLFMSHACYVGLRRPGR